MSRIFTLPEAADYDTYHMRHGLNIRQSSAYGGCLPARSRSLFGLVLRQRR